MTDEALESNVFYQHVKAVYGAELEVWVEPYWVVCVPTQEALAGRAITRPLVESHALKQQGQTGDQYSSALHGDTTTYQITGDEPRVIVAADDDLGSSRHAGDDDDEGVVVTKVTVLDEYLVTFKDKVVHVVLIDRLLSPGHDDRLADQLVTTVITSFTQAEKFLRKFRCHRASLWGVDQRVAEAAEVVRPSAGVDDMQNELQDTLIQCWEDLLKRHPPNMQCDNRFQDLLFRALDYYIVGRLHEMLWWLVCERCQLVDNIVKTRLNHLRHSHLSALQLGVKPSHYTPLPAAVVELASLASVESAVGRLQCVHNTIELIHAQAKEARVTLHQYRDQDGEPELALGEDEVVALLTTVVVQAQCRHLVANIYYMTHFVFSVTEDDPLWGSLGLLRRTLEGMMKLDVARLPPPAKTIRKELSLQDLMQVSAEVESRFEGKESSRSISDITALDLQLHQLTQQIQLSTQAHSESQLTDRNSPGRSSERAVVSPTQEGARTQSFRDFISSIPSSLRESLRRRQTQQRSAIQTSLSDENG